MIDLLLMKKCMVHYLQDVRAVREKGRSLSNHHVVLCKVSLMSAWIKRKEVVNGAKRIRSEQLRDHQSMEEMPGVLKVRE